MGKHALLSASASHRWLNCTPSARLEREFDDNSGEAAAVGTAAHALSKHKLRRALKMRSKKPVSKYGSDEMDGYTDGYVQFILEQLATAKQVCTDPMVLIEQRLDFSKYVPEGFGTGDCLIIADGILHIVDFKYGQGVLVESEGNPQMKLYALGALELFDGIYDIREVSMTIYQPRRDNVWYSGKACINGQTKSSNPQRLWLIAAMESIPAASGVNFVGQKMNAVPAPNTIWRLPSTTLRNRLCWKMTRSKAFSQKLTI